MVKRIMAENKAASMDQRKYQMRRNGLVVKYEAVRDGFCGKFSGEHKNAILFFFRSHSCYVNI